MSAGPRIRILPDALINKIAAGEVVERPASVVKELVENAVDAGATSVRVEIRTGGRTLIRVRDNGQGMTRDDALLAIERHATSKIRTPEQLFQIQTLGFRGEALPSMAQVSRMEIKTAVAGEEVGTHVLIDGGVLKDVRDAPPVPGTEITVRRLFFNTPVRLRFLKGERTELGHVVEAMNRIALSRPDVGFELIKEDAAGGANALIRTPPAPDLARRVSDLLGRSTGDGLQELDARDGEMRLHGLVASPSLTRSSRNALYLFVNGRPVRDRVLLGAVLSAYRGLAPKGRYPVVVLFLELPLGDVDHNVHPTKTEVRFIRSNIVYRFLVEAISATLRGRPTAETSVAPAGTPSAVGAPSLPPSTGAGTPSWQVVRESLFDDVGSAPRPAPPLPSTSAPAAPEHAPAAPSAEAAPVARGFRFAHLQYVGVYEGTYLIFQDGIDLLLLDQHAAHERINYERLLRAEEGTIESQGLLVPEVIELPRSQSEVLLTRLDMLSSMGIEIADFGGGSVAVTAVPPALEPGQVRELIEDLAQELLGVRPATAAEELRHRVAALAACHCSVRAHQRLSPEEVRALLAGLDGAELPFTCPHGRPLLVRFTRDDVKRWFERT